MERQVSGYILSGGKNSRMNGEKKLFLLLDGIPFYQHILRALSPLPSVRLSVERLAPRRSLQTARSPRRVLRPHPKAKTRPNLH